MARTVLKNDHLTLFYLFTRRSFYVGFGTNALNSLLEKRSSPARWQHLSEDKQIESLYS